MGSIFAERMRAHLPLGASCRQLPPRFVARRGALDRGDAQLRPRLAKGVLPRLGLGAMHENDGSRT